MACAREGFDHVVLERLEAAILGRGASCPPIGSGNGTPAHLVLFALPLGMVKQGVEERLAAYTSCVLRFSCPQKLRHREAWPPREAAPQTEQSSRLSEVT